MDPVGLEADELRLEERLRATEALRPDRDDLGRRGARSPSPGTTKTMPGPSPRRSPVRGGGGGGGGGVFPTIWKLKKIEAIPAQRRTASP